MASAPLSLLLLQAPKDPLLLQVRLPEPPWVFEVSTASWQPPWLKGSIAAVVIVSVLAACLLLMMLVSRKQYKVREGVAQREDPRFCDFKPSFVMTKATHLRL